MKILAFDTSSACTTCGAFLYQPDHLQVLAMERLEPPARLSSDFHARLRALLDGAGWTAAEVEAVAVAAGPGSWTGLRIGMTTARTWCQSRTGTAGGTREAGECVLKAVPLFPVLARVASAEVAGGSLLAVVAPCRPGELYAQIFRDTEQLLPLTEVIILSPELLHQRLLELARLHGSSFAVTAPPGVAAEIATHCYQPGSLAVVQELARQAGHELTSRGADDPLSTLPLYVAPSSAERNRAAQLTGRISADHAN